MTEIIVTPNVKRVGAGQYQVASETREGTYYAVDLNATTCQCPHHYHRLRGQSQLVCKHIEAARARQEAVTEAQIRQLKDVQIDELCCYYEERRPELAARLLAEIRRRGAEYAREQREQMLRTVFA